MRRVDAAQILQLAASTFAIEAQALSAMAERLDDNFVQAVQHILTTRGRVVVTGMGKSGHVGRKIAAHVLARVQAVGVADQHHSGNTGVEGLHQTTHQVGGTGAQRGVNHRRTVGDASPSVCSEHG